MYSEARAAIAPGLATDYESNFLTACRTLPLPN